MQYRSPAPAAFVLVPRKSLKAAGRKGRSCGCSIGYEGRIPAVRCGLNERQRCAGSGPHGAPPWTSQAMQAADLPHHAFRRPAIDTSGPKLTPIQADSRRSEISSSRNNLIARTAIHKYSEAKCIRPHLPTFVTCWYRMNIHSALTSARTRADYYTILLCPDAQ